jgi:hypothetical protein
MTAIPSAGRLFSKTYQATTWADENPLRENGIWVLGARDGLDRSDLQTVGGLLCGTQTGNAPTYNDSLGVLANLGGWSPDTYVKSTIKSINQQSGTCYCEVEHLHRFTITANQCKGYEINFRCNHDGSQYIGIVIWLGPVGTIGSDTSASFLQLGSNDTGPGIFDGDDIYTTCQTKSTGVVLTAYIDHHDGNGFVQVSTRTDTAFTYRTGSPGAGHWMHLNGATGVFVTDFGHTKVRAGNLA